MTRRLTDRTLVVATGNAGKLEEMRQLLAPRGIAITSLKDHALPEPAEIAEAEVDAPSSESVVPVT